MNIELSLIAILAIALVISFIWNRHNEDAIVDLRNEIAYNKILPQVEEYAKLKGFMMFYRDGANVRIGNVFIVCNELLLISDLPRKLEDLKKTLERNCPTKCVAKKRK